MSLISGDSSAEIQASQERCWEVVVDSEHAPDWQQGLRAVNVSERDAEGRPLICEFVIDAKFREVRCTVQMSYEPPSRMAFSRIAGDAEALEGSWELQALGETRTRATYRLAVDPGHVGLLARPLEKALRPIVVGARPSELAREVARRAQA